MKVQRGPISMHLVKSYRRTIHLNRNLNCLIRIGCIGLRDTKIVVSGMDASSCLNCIRPASSSTSSSIHVGQDSSFKIILRIFVWYWFISSSTRQQPHEIRIIHIYCNWRQRNGVPKSFVRNGHGRGQIRNFNVHALRETDFA